MVFAIGIFFVHNTVYYLFEPLVLFDWLKSIIDFKEVFY